MVVAFAPQFFLLIGIDVFLGGSILTVLLDKYFPTGLPYILDIGSLIGFAELLIGPQFMSRLFFYAAILLLLWLSRAFCFEHYRTEPLPVFREEGSHRKRDYCDCCHHTFNPCERIFRKCLCERNFSELTSHPSLAAECDLRSILCKRNNSAGCNYPHSTRAQRKNSSERRKDRR